MRPKMPSDCLCKSFKLASVKANGKASFSAVDKSLTVRGGLLTVSRKYL